MEYKINNDLLAKLQIKASQENKSVEVLINDLLKEATKDIKIESTEFIKPKSVKRKF